jgi:FlaA1/EpsC-like NDP-sugar epimerase
MTYRQRLSLLIFVDSFIVLTSIFLSRILLSANFQVITFTLIVSSLTLFISHNLFASINKLYKRAWEYASIGELVSIFKAVTFSIITTGIVQFILIQDIFFRILVVTWLLHMILIGGSRFCWRIFRDAYFNNKNDKKRTLIVGAGSAGTMVVRQLLQNNNAELLPVAFVDDNVKKHNLDIMGVPVIGGTNSIEQTVQELDIENIVIAIPSLSKRELSHIFNECSKTKAKTKILPMLEDIMTGKVSVNQFRDVQVEDLLGRDPIELDMESISDSLTNKTILVTGAGGSIGSEICRQVSRFSPAKLILLGHGENSIYGIEMELREFYNESFEIITEIADIQDRYKMFEVMEKHQPNVVYHAAAHKHVPLMERNPEEAVKNNVIGTRNVAEAADAASVQTFVMVSTDKAVNPTSVMGATKRLAEMVVQYMDTISNTRFVAVRFGNVLGSRGSVIPLFKKQIQKGGPVTVTHPDMVRYFMTIPEASRLVIQAGAIAQGGEIFVLDMGEPVKIVDLAKNLIKLSGYSIDEIGINFSGIRPGEKLFEELLSKDEVHDEQVYPKIYIGKSMNPDIRQVTACIEEYEELGKQGLRERLLDIAYGRYEEKKQKTAVKEEVYI